MFGPVLRGEKCTLRPPRKEDLTTYQRWFEDTETLRFLPGLGAVLLLVLAPQHGWLGPVPRLLIGAAFAAVLLG